MASQNSIDTWFSAIGTAGNYRTMHYFDGDGNINRVFEINFEGGYINQADVKAFMTNDVSRETQVLSPVFQGPNSIRFAVAVPVGWTVLIYRDTPKAKPLSQFVDGAIINANNLDRNAKQAVFAVSEMVDRFDSTVEQVNSALVLVVEANEKSDQALAAANAASSKAGQAIQTANAADGKADQAIQTANSATQTANGAVTTADGAVVTANEAKQIAEGIDAKADQAISTADAAKATAEGIDAKAEQAIQTANEAKAAATQAVNTANGIDAKASKALQDSAEALQKANEAIIAGGIGAELVARVDSMPAGNNNVNWKGDHKFRQARAAEVIVESNATGAGQIATDWLYKSERSAPSGDARAIHSLFAIGGSKNNLIARYNVADPARWPAGGSVGNDAHLDLYAQAHLRSILNVYNGMSVSGTSDFNGAVNHNAVVTNKQNTVTNGESRYDARQAIILNGSSAQGQFILGRRDGADGWWFGRQDGTPEVHWSNVAHNTRISLGSQVATNKQVHSEGFVAANPATFGLQHKCQTTHWGGWIDVNPALQMDVEINDSVATVWRSTHWGVGHLSSAQVYAGRNGSHIIRHNAGNGKFDMHYDGYFNTYSGDTLRWTISDIGNIKGDAFGGKWITQWVSEAIWNHSYDKPTSDARYAGSHKTVGDVGQVAMLLVYSNREVAPNDIVYSSNEAIHYSDGANFIGWRLPNNTAWRCLGHQGPNRATLYVRIS